MRTEAERIRHADIEKESQNALLEEKVKELMNEIKHMTSSMSNAGAYVSVEKLAEESITSNNSESLSEINQLKLQH